MKLSKRGDFRRRAASFRRHVLFMVQPLAVALGASLLWYGMWSNHVSFPEGDEAILLCIIGGLIVAFSISAAEVLRSVREKTQVMSGIVLRRDQSAFMQLRDERMPIVMNLFQITISALLVSMTVLVHYRDQYVGAASVFSVSLVIALYFFAIVELQDPTDSPWFAERIPPEWLALDIDEYFGMSRTQERTPAQ